MKPLPPADSYTATSDGNIVVDGKIKGTSVQHDGYKLTFIKGGHYKTSRLVCAWFHGPPPPDRPFVDHINRDRKDDRPDNLRWVTATENNQNKKICRGEENGGGRKLTREKATEIIENRESLTRKQLSIAYGVSVSLIDKMRCGTKWATV